MNYKGTVKNGVVVLPPEVKLPEGAEVNVEPVDLPPKAQRMYSYFGDTTLSSRRPLSCRGQQTPANCQIVRCDPEVTRKGGLGTRLNSLLI